MADRSFISIIVPVYNEEKNIPLFYDSLIATLTPLSYTFELIFVNDGSDDGSLFLIEGLVETDSRVRILDFSRNFGKESALTAGLEEAKGEAVIMIDADLQHPTELIPELLLKWNSGAEVVVGVRQSNQQEGFIKHYGSQLFYWIIKHISETTLVPNATDFRLLDASVVKAFCRFTERGRMTRALVDWLGFKRVYVPFNAGPRANGRATYSLWKLLHLAVNSFVSFSLFPLKLVGYFGLFIIFTSGPFGLYVLIGKYFLHTAFASSFSGPAQLALITIFMVGIMMSALGLITLYIAGIHGEVLNRPLYVLRTKRSKTETV